MIDIINMENRINISDSCSWSPKKLSMGSSTLKQAVYSLMDDIKHRYIISMKNIASLLRVKYFVIDIKINWSFDSSKMTKENTSMLQIQTHALFSLIKSQNKLFSKHCFSNGWSCRKCSQRIDKIGALIKIRVINTTTPVGIVMEKRFPSLILSLCDVLKFVLGLVCSNILLILCSVSNPETPFKDNPR